MKTRFSRRAEADLDEIRDYIARDDERAADRVVSRIRQTVEMFNEFPMLGHEGDVEGTREFKVTGLPYLVVYEIISSTEITVLTVIHNRRNYP